MKAKQTKSGKPDGNSRRPSKPSASTAPLTKATKQEKLIVARLLAEPPANAKRKSRSPAAPAPRASAKNSTGTHNDYPNLYPDGFDDCARNLLLAPPSDKPITVLCIGDSHAHPGIKDLRNYVAVGRLAARRRYDWLVHIGDAYRQYMTRTGMFIPSLKGRHQPVRPKL